jgi:hypothetical protein
MNDKYIKRNIFKIKIYRYLMKLFNWDYPVLYT